MLNRENNYGIKSRITTKCCLESRDIIIEAEYLRHGDLRIARKKGGGVWSYVIIPQELLDKLISFTAKGGEL